MSSQMPKINKWTVMFFFAGDNALSPLIVSQVKAIKDAGFQEDTEVLVYFDSNEKGVPTRIFNVNLDRKKDPKLPKSMIGDGNDPFVRNMKKDNIDPTKMRTSLGTAADEMKKGLKRPSEINASEALKNFVNYCHESHRAKHYILFLVGHGLIVGNDKFLPDENPDSAITLKELDQEILRPFSVRVKDDKGTFEMLALHSCSMSAIEVAYQLKGTANYMMASEGISYVGSWPYRQLLKKTFNTIEEAKNGKANRAGEGAAGKNRDVNVPGLVEKLYYLSLCNATDFMLSGYSLDLCLCRLAAKKVEGLKEPLQKLVARLKDGLKNERGRELILLAHWESQSYWEESYTDLYDFCLCLSRKCNSKNKLQRSISDACDGVMKKIDALVVHSDNFGSKYQYSHGLSVYFPWSEPVEDEPVPDKPADFQAPPPRKQKDMEQPTQKDKIIMKNYQDYDFTLKSGHIL